jgi:putative tryptophan/tyrosine transport system substrate-binding protein
MRRREFITLLGGATAWPLVARAQQRKIRRVGFLAIPLRPAVLESSRYGAFAQGMRKLGYVEGDNLAIEYRFAEGKAERLSNLVAELLELKPDVLVVAGTPAVRAAQEATTSIPIVMATTNDPIGSGFVEALARPGGNITGLSNLSTDLSPKLMEMLRSIAPKLSRVAILVNPTNQSPCPGRSEPPGCRAGSQPGDRDRRGSNTAGNRECLLEHEPAEYRSGHRRR